MGVRNFSHRLGEYLPNGYPMLFGKGKHQASLTSHCELDTTKDQDNRYAGFPVPRRQDWKPCFYERHMGFRNCPKKFLTFLLNKFANPDFFGRLLSLPENPPTLVMNLASENYRVTGAQPLG